MATERRSDGGTAPDHFAVFGVAGAAFLVGVALPVLGVLSGWDLPMVISNGAMPGVAFVVLGIWAIRRPEELRRILGAAVGASSAPLYYFPLLGFGHPLDAGVDLGRACVGLLALVVLPLNMRFGARTAKRLEQPTDPAQGPSQRIALAVGLGAVLIALLIVWQANSEASPDPDIAWWEFVHHGIVPALPILVVGVCTAVFPSRLTLMAGALVGVLPALACSSLLVDPDPSNHGQTPLVLLAYTLPLTLPITVGYGVLTADDVRQRILRFVNRG